MDIEVVEEVFIGDASNQDTPRGGPASAKYVNLRFDVVRRESSTYLPTV